MFALPTYRAARRSAAYAAGQRLAAGNLRDRKQLFSMLATVELTKRYDEQDDERIAA